MILFIIFFVKWQKFKITLRKIEEFVKSDKVTVHPRTGYEGLEGE